MVKYNKRNCLIGIIAFSCIFVNSVMAEATLTRVSGDQANGNQDRFLIKDKNCELVKKHIHTLSTWTKKIEKSASCNESVINVSATDQECSADVSRCLPKHVLKYQGINPAHMGPNCWNLSLVMKEILPGLRYSTPEEMAFYMRPPLCRNLKNGEKIEPGDVGAIRGVFEGMKEESHGFIYLSKELSYSKNGFNKKSAYEVQSLEKVLTTYGVPDDPKCRQNKLDTHSDCGNAVSYFRCTSFEDFLKKNSSLKSPSISSIKHVIHFEQCLERATIDGVMLKENAVSTLNDSILILVNYLNAKKYSSASKSSEEENFVLASLYLRLNAIGEQLETLSAPSDPDQLIDGPDKNSKNAYELAEIIKASHQEIIDLVEGINQ